MPPIVRKHRGQKRSLPLEPSPRKDADYAGGVSYWSTQPASIDGVLGGYGNLTSIDALSSRMFLLTVAQRLSTISGSAKTSANGTPGGEVTAATVTTTTRTRALDVGAGVGRVTENVLLPLVDEVDVVEPVEHLVKEAKRAAEAGEWKHLGQSGQKTGAEGQETVSRNKKIRFYQRGLQDFDPCKGENTGLIGTLDQTKEENAHSEAEGDTPDGYDVIWCQWCLGHLSDDQLIEWFKKCKKALRSSLNGDAVIIVKENTTRKGLREYDNDDRSWTRSTQLWKTIFDKAGLKVVREEEQQGFPEELFPVWMYALR